ncbi:peroxisomal membrane protein pex14 [Diatrype stigma]|uniref:Peroxisomal membrane protein PEX14 n=1 Tax=Diatrype stigma TaxID=117547 RepID=A0AAN9YT55_9PEZI
MTIREDIVTSAVSFLQDPNVASSPIESQLSFLHSKNLTQEEIDAAYARAGTASPPSQQVVQQQRHQQQPPAPQPYYGQQYPSQPYGWQAPPPEPPKRDWRDWFIMATVMGGVSYGLYSLTKRYVAPLISPPTPEKLDKDKATVDEQFEKTFASLEQLARDTEALKASEQERTEKLDKVLEELEAVMRDTKAAGRRQEDETDRLRDDMKTLKGAIPGAMAAHKDFTDGRLKEIASEVRSLKALIGQRMNAPPAPAPAPAPSVAPTLTASPTTTTPTTTTSSNFLRPTTNGSAAPLSSPATATGTPSSSSAPAKENGSAANNGDGGASVSSPTAGKQDYLSSLGGRSSPFGSGAPAGKASIPAWQLAAAKSSDPTSTAGAAGGASSSTATAAQPTQAGSSS